MADGAEDPGIDQAGDGKVVGIRSDETGSGVRRTTEGGLTLRFAFDIPKLPSLKCVPTWTHQQLINGALMGAVAVLLALAAYQYFAGSSGTAAEPAAATGPLRSNVQTEFNPTIDQPVAGAGTYIDKLASVIGSVTLGERAFVGPFASIRGDEGQPIVIGAGSNVQDMVVVHALETFDGARVVDANLVTVEGKKYAVYIGKNVSLAHQSQVHGPAAVGDNTFVGMQALVFKATVGKNVVIEPGAKVMGVNVADGRYVPAGTTVTTQEAADALPKITPDYVFAKLNAGVLQVNQEFADAYLAAASGGAEAAPKAEAAP